MDTYDISSTKQRETLTGTLRDAVARATAVEAELQPASDVEAAFLDGRLSLLIDGPTKEPMWRFNYAGGHGSQAEGRLVHVMSRPAGGEIRGYVLTSDGVLRLRMPCYSGRWPEMDEAVRVRVGASTVFIGEASDEP